MSKISLNDISIRTELRPGDIGDVLSMHGRLYYKEYGYTGPFEMYVAQSLAEFTERYTPERSRIWVCEHKRSSPVDEGRPIGTLALLDRGESAQLRYFLLESEYRGVGLGTKLMDLFMEFLRSCGYKSSYLWTTEQQLTAAKLYRRYGYQFTEEKPSTAFGIPLIEQRYDLILP
ncbi:MAG: GNAT family N-acetyltransferase [Anaerolineales bacterium]|nr:GNAT family N-acetyltransferase [Anaerolineales bacterium]